MCAGKQGPPAITRDIDSVGEFGRPTSVQGDGGLYRENNAVAVATGSLGRAAFRTGVPLIVFKYALEPGPPSAPRFSAIIYTTTTTATQTQTPPARGVSVPDIG